MFVFCLGVLCCALVVSWASVLVMLSCDCQCLFLQSLWLPYSWVVVATVLVVVADHSVCCFSSPKVNMGVDREYDPWFCFLGPAFSFVPFALFVVC